MPQLRCLVFGNNMSSMWRKAQAAAPLKWSPEDHRANIRRQLNNVESPDWAQTIPTLPSLEEMRSGADQQEEE